MEDIQLECIIHYWRRFFLIFYSLRLNKVNEEEDKFPPGDLKMTGGFAVENIDLTDCYWSYTSLGLG